MKGLAEAFEPMVKPRRKQKSRLRPDLRLLELSLLWKAATSPSKKTADSVERTVREFTDLVGDLPANRIVAEDLFEYRDALMILPKSMPVAMRAKSFSERVAHFRQHPGDGPRLSSSSVKRTLSHIKALLSLAYSERWINNDRWRGVKVKEYKSANGRRSFQKSELTTLFGSRLFTGAWSRNRRRRAISDETMRWLFLFGLTLGVRLSEIGQAALNDFGIEEGIFVFRIDEELRGSLEDVKSVKTLSSRRTVPVHSRILALGFAEKVEWMRRLGQTRLFPDLKRDIYDQYTQIASIIANREIDRHFSTPRLCFHSLRHSWKDLAKEARILETVSDQITGHSPNSAGRRYGNGVSLPELQKELELISFSFIDWDAITAASAR